MSYPLAVTSRILSADERQALGVCGSASVWALLSADGDAVAYVREGDGSGRPGYGSIWSAQDSGKIERDRFGEYRRFDTRSIALYTLPLAFIDTTD